MIMHDKRLVTHLLTKSIVELCKSTELYDGRIDVDGILCISGEVEGQQIVVKVHESYTTPPPPPVVLMKNGGRHGGGAYADVPRQKPNPLYMTPLDSYGRDHVMTFDDTRMAVGCKRKRLDILDTYVPDRISSMHGPPYPYFGFNCDTYATKMSDVGVAQNLSLKHRVRDSSNVNSTPQNLNSSYSQRGASDNKNSSAHDGLLENGANSTLERSYNCSSPCKEDEEDVSEDMTSPSNNSGSSPGDTLVPECRQCEQTFDGADALREHNDTVHSVQTCLVCYNTFTSRSNLDRHSRLHSGARPFVCDVCTKSFSRKDHLLNHMTKHIYHCTTCGKNLSDRPELATHCIEEHGITLTDACMQCAGVSCTCGVETIDKDLEVECQRPSSPPPYSSLSADEVLQHWRPTMINSARESDERPEYAIRIPSSGGMDAVHVKTWKLGMSDAGNGRPYNCPVCPESFNDSLLFNEHLASHHRRSASVSDLVSASGRFECCICRQFYATSDALHQHKAMHASSFPLPAFTSPLSAAATLSSLAPISSTLPSIINRSDSLFIDQLHDLSRHRRLSVDHSVDQCPDRSLSTKNNRSNDSHRQYLDNYPRHASNTISASDNFLKSSKLSNGNHSNGFYSNGSHDNDTATLRRDKRKQKLPKAIVATNDVEDDEDDQVREPSLEVDIIEPLSPNDLSTPRRSNDGKELPVDTNDVEKLRSPNDNPSTGYESSVNGGATEDEIIRTKEIKIEPMVRSIMPNRPVGIITAASRYLKNISDQRVLNLSGHYDPSDPESIERPESSMSRSSQHGGLLMRAGRGSPLLRPTSSLRSASPLYRPCSSMRSVTPLPRASSTLEYRSASSASFTVGDSPSHTSSPHRKVGRSRKALLNCAGVDESIANDNINSAKSSDNDRLGVEFLPGGPYSCSVCNMGSIETWEILETHCLTEHSRNPCRYCTKTFAQKANRDRHVCLHTGDKPYGCPDCQERFSRGDKLKMHRIRTHGVQYPAYTSRADHAKDDPFGTGSGTRPSGRVSLNPRRPRALRRRNQARNKHPQEENNFTPSAGAPVSNVPGQSYSNFLSAWMMLPARARLSSSMGAVSNVGSLDLSSSLSLFSGSHSTAWNNFLGGDNEHLPSSYMSTGQNIEPRALTTEQEFLKNSWSAAAAAVHSASVQSRNATGRTPTPRSPRFPYIYPKIETAETNSERERDVETRVDD